MRSVSLLFPGESFGLSFPSGKLAEVDAKAESKPTFVAENIRRSQLRLRVLDPGVAPSEDGVPHAADDE